MFDIQVPGLLKRIMDEDVYKSDYEGLTEQLLEGKVDYALPLNTLQKIIDSRSF